MAREIHRCGGEHDGKEASPTAAGVNGARRGPWCGTGGRHGCTAGPRQQREEVARTDATGGGRSATVGGGRGDVVHGLAAVAVDVPQLHPHRLARGDDQGHRVDPNDQRRLLLHRYRAGPRPLDGHRAWAGCRGEQLHLKPQFEHRKAESEPAARTIIHADVYYKPRSQALLSRH